MQGNILGQTGGGLKINGIIEEYKVASGGNVRAGDFVKYINTYQIEETDYKQLNENNRLSYRKNAIALNENKILITYQSITNDKCLYGVVCTINHNKINVGTETILLNNQNFISDIQIEVIEENKVFITYVNLVNLKHYLYGIICTINEDTITMEINKEITLLQYGNYTDRVDNIVMNKLDNNRYFITCTISNPTHPTYQYYRNLYAVICTINENDIILSNTKELTRITDSGYPKLKTIVIDENKILVVYTNGYGTTYLYGMICAINENEISIGTSTVLDQTSNLNSITKYNIDNKYLIGYGMNVMICTINENGMDVKILKMLDCGIQDLFLLCDDFIFILGIGNNYTTNVQNLYGMICTIKEDMIVENKVLLNTAKTYMGITSLLVKDNIFVTYSLERDENSSTYNLYSILCNLGEPGILQIKTNTDTILGIAKTKGTEGQTVKVYVPKLSEYISTEDENRIITENGEEIRNE